MDITRLLPTSDPAVMQSKHGDKYTERPCEGCGELAWIITEKGRKDRFCSRACAQRGANNSVWVGDDADYNARHLRMRKIRGKADHCIHRASGHCTSTNYYWAQIHGTSGLDPYDYVPMCRSCHARYDYRGGNAVPRPHIQGSKSYLAKLTDDEVREIRSRPVVRGSITAWAREFHVTPAAMCRIVNGETYKNVPMPEGIR